VAWSGIPAGSVAVRDGHWSPRLALNRSRALLYQWERYEACGTLGNFRILAGLEEGRRRGFFYTDSDLHKWADAASGALVSGADEAIEARLAEYIDLVGRCQEPDGYLFTYNQIHFPGTRWKNLQIEHELYCLGHFVEAGVSHFEATGRRELLGLAEKAALLVVGEFTEAGPERTSGHEEMEIALLRLYRLSGRVEYLECARALLERRGRIRAFGARFVAQAASQLGRSRTIRRRQRRKEGLGFEFGGNMGRREPPLLLLRALPLFLSGAYQQQDRPMREQVEPRGHAVRWAYLMRAGAMLLRESPEASLLEWQASAWEALVDEKLFVTGGLGALPLIEGFGRPFELDNRYSYSETCAAIGSVLWNRELSLATGEARYADLLEWQLENAASVGISLSGDRYFYRNPLAADGELERRAWYATACCPSNLSRLWAALPGLSCSRQGRDVRMDLYLGGVASLGKGLSLTVESALPWEGCVRIEAEAGAPFRLLLRVPGWARLAKASIAGGEERLLERQPSALFGSARFGGSEYLPLEVGGGRSSIRLELSMDIAPLRAPRRVRADRGRVAVTRGPLVYCAETADNGSLDLETLVLDPASLRHEWRPELLGGCGTIAGRTDGGEALCLIPYCLWGNRGAGSMRVWLRCAGLAGKAPLSARG
jgi:uncharacterized protein